MTPPLRDRSDLVWLTWITAVLASFGVLEGLAYRTSRPRTLSRSLRRWFGLNPRCRRRYFSATALVGAVVALWVHLETLGD